MYIYVLIRYFYIFARSFDFHNGFVLPPAFSVMRAACFSNFVMKKNAIFAA